jgi:hypothetical protein
MPEESKPMTGSGRLRRCWRNTLAPPMSAGLFVTILLVVGLSADRAPCSSPSEQYLRDKKALIPIGRGQIWISPLEVRIRRRMAEMDRLEISILATQRLLEDRIEQNLRNWQAQQPRKQALQAALNGLASSDPQRAALETQLLVLERLAVAPPRLGEVPDVQSRLVELTRNRNALAIAVLWVRSTVSELQRQYRELADDPQVAAALTNLGDKHRLGPDKDYHKQIGKFHRLALTDHLPLYLQSDRYRFCALASEQTPLTFSWREDDGVTLITSSMVERLGLQIPATAPIVQQQVGNRRLATRRIVIPSLRLGRFLLRDLEAFVLPPEGEDLGATLGRRACGDLKVHLEPERLRIRWQAAN